MGNITGDGKFTFKLKEVVNALYTGTLEFFTATFDILLFITASLGNTLVLIVLHNVTSIYPPTKLFFRCLAVPNLCVELLVRPLHATEIPLSHDRGERERFELDSRV